MKNFFLIGTLIALFSMPAIAFGAGPRTKPVVQERIGGVYWALGSGKTSNVKNVDAETSIMLLDWFVGYKFNRVIAAEIGSVQLLDNAYFSNSSYNTVTVEGKEVAGLLFQNMGSNSAIFLRLGYADMKSNARINFVDTPKVSLTGPTYGIGVQLGGIQSGRLGIRLGYNMYSLTASNSGAEPFEPTSINLLIVGQF